MAGKIIADTLEHSTAGSVTTDYVVNGSAKAWVRFDPNTITDSNNYSSATDNSTGDFTFTFTSSLTDANFAVVYGGRGSAGTTGAFNSNANQGGANSASSCRTVGSRTGTDTGADPAQLYNMVQGDLA